MFRLKHSTLILISGLVWLGIGYLLLTLGLNFTADALASATSATSHPVLTSLSPYVGGMEQAVVIWIALALGIGFFKARFVFSKSVQKSVQRILSLPNPVSIAKIYAPSYYLLLGSMVFLGILVRFLPLDIRGGVDIVIGSALISGAVLYFRQAFANWKQTAN